MSRYCGNKNSTPILTAAEDWKKQVLLEDGSLFSDDAIWTLDNARALETHFVNNPDDRDLGFFAKLEEQLEPPPPQVKQLAAEMLWVMFLCPSNISAEKKREGIRTIWNWSGKPFPEDSVWLTDETLDGVGSAGTGYNTNRWREFTFFVRLLLALKPLDRMERESLLNDGWRFAQWLEQIPECNKRQLRHMLLFLLFPDQFERIFGGTDRVSIVRAFRGLTRKEAKELSALEIERLLAEIRKEAEYGTTELDFYLPPLRERWKEENNVWLISWDPAVDPWDDFEQDLARLQQGEEVHRRFPVSDRRIAIGDKVYLRRASEPAGIIGVGTVLELPVMGADKENLLTADIAITQLVDPEKESFLPQSDLESIKLGKQEWRPEATSIPVKKKAVGALEARWQKIVEPTPIIKPAPSVSRPINLILYGPPGTGKTYHLREQIMPDYVSREHVDPKQWLLGEMEGVSWFEVIFATLYDIGRAAKVNEIEEHKFVVAKARTLSSNQHVKNTIWATLQNHASLDSLLVKTNPDKRYPPLVFDKTEESAWKLVGNWQEECEYQIELAQRWKAGPKPDASENRFLFVTFHQAYSYEDFVEGIRPMQDEESGEVEYRVSPGVFRKICQRAKSDPDHRYAIFIDEINRGNIAKIFGELITLIEPDKRAEYDSQGQLVKGMEATLPYSGDRFGVPVNLDIFGTMNTADRSIALLDTALRRRFDFEPLLPNPALVSGSRGDGYIEDGEGSLIDLRRLLETMNQRIEFLLNRDMMLGHSFFMRVRTFSDLRRVFLNQVVPLLQEYFYEDWRRIQLVFGDVDQLGQPVEPQIVKHQVVASDRVFGFDHDELDERIRYQVAPQEEITPDAIRKIYENET